MATASELFTKTARFASALVMGRLESDPVYTAAANGGTARAEFSVGYSTARDGECAESIPVIAHAGQADAVRDNLHAGDLVCVDGKIDTRQPLDGSPRIVYATSITFVAPRQHAAG